MINANFKAVFNRLFEPVGRFFIRVGLTPNQLTTIGLFFGVLTCWVYIWTRNAVLFTALIVFCAFFDAFDGAVARLGGKVTRFGSYFDAVCDRLFEGFVLVSVAYVTGYWILIGVLLIGFFVISYAKARAAMEVSISNLEWPDLMEKAERGVIFILGLLISEMTHIWILGHDLFYWVLVVLLVLVYGTVIQRILRAKRYIESRS